MPAKNPPKLPQTEQREQRDGGDRVTDATDAKDDSAPFLQIRTLQEAVRLSLTGGITEKTLFKFARAIIAFELTVNMRTKQSDIPSVFAEWWRTAQTEKLLPKDASFDEYAILFEDAFARAKVPLGANALATAIKRAEMAPLPESAKQFTDPKIQKLVAIGFQLQTLAGSSPFFLSVRDCAKVYGTKRLETASAILNGFVRRGIFKLHKKGLPGGKQASRFWYGDAKGTLLSAAMADDSKPKEAAPTPARKREMWQLLQDEKTLKARIEGESERTNPDKEIMKSLRGAMKAVRNEIRSLKPTEPDKPPAT